MKGDEIELRFPARAEHLGLVRLVVSSLAENEAGLSAARLDDLRLAVSEACANAVEAYGRLGQPAGLITVRCMVGPGEVVVEVHDDAGGFDVRSLVPHPPVDAPERLDHERGLGIPLMRQLAGAEFEATEEGTTVRLLVRAKRQGRATP